MTVEELISANNNITDICIEVRVDGCALLDVLHIGLDYGVEPPYPQMVPKDRLHIGSQSLDSKRKSTYIRKSINAWDDGRDYWQVKPSRIPKAWLELEVYSWQNWHVYKGRHPRSSTNPNGSYDGIQIIALPAGEHMMRMPEERVLKSEPTNLDQITLFDMEGEGK